MKKDKHGKHGDKGKKGPKKPENIVDMLKELAGLPVSREDAWWFDLGKMDVEAGKYTVNGKLYFSLELIPMEQVTHDFFVFLFFFLLCHHTHSLSRSTFEKIL